MRTLFCSVLAVLLLALAVDARAQAVKTAGDDQTSVSVTVYNSNIGVIKDTRRLSLPVGSGELRFMDVASGIIPETVLVRSLTQPEKFQVQEQNYEYDLIDRKKLLDKYVGMKVKIVPFDQSEEKRVPVEATLVANNNGEVYDINGEIFLGHPGVTVLPSIPENLIAKPTLTWMYANENEGGQDIEVAYMTNNINWRADYVLSLDKADKAGDLSGWVTLDNKSGATYKNAQLKLVAGKVNRAEENNRRGGRRNDMVMMESMSEGSAFKEEAFFEYHLYDLQRKTTVKDNQTKQVSLLEASAVPLRKEFVIDDAEAWWFYQGYNERQQKKPVKVMVIFRNDAASHLGMPLPAGIIRLYKQDSSGGAQFIGEDNIDHTPKDEEVRKVGEAFDVVSERKQTDFRRLGDRVYEAAWEIKLRNHKKEDITVQVIEPIAGFSEWQILQSSFPYTKIDAAHVRFDVPVAKDGEAVLSYTYQVTN